MKTTKTAPIPQARPGQEHSILDTTHSFTEEQCPALHNLDQATDALDRLSALVHSFDMLGSQQDTSIHDENTAWRLHDLARDEIQKLQRYLSVLRKGGYGDVSHNRHHKD